MGSYNMKAVLQIKPLQSQKSIEMRSINSINLGKIEQKKSSKPGKKIFEDHQRNHSNMKGMLVGNPIMGIKKV
jgi:hypothetical protein